MRFVMYIASRATSGLFVHHKAAAMVLRALQLSDLATLWALSVPGGTALLTLHAVVYRSLILSDDATAFFGRRCVPILFEWCEPRVTGSQPPSATFQLTLANGSCCNMHV